ELLRQGEARFRCDILPVSDTYLADISTVVSIGLFIHALAESEDSPCGPVKSSPCSGSMSPRITSRLSIGCTAASSIKRGAACAYVRAETVLAGLLHQPTAHRTTKKGSTSGTSGRYSLIGKPWGIWKEL